MKDIYDILRVFRDQKERDDFPRRQFALATLVRVEGSSYRRPGARMLICENSRTVGSLSGGCLEEEVALRALEVLRDDCSAIMSFDTHRRFGCAGKIDIFIERVSEKFLPDLAAHLEARHGCVVITEYEGNKTGSRVLESAEMVLDRDCALTQEIDPPIQLLIFGGGPDSTPLRGFAEDLGWSVINIEHATELPSQLDQWSAAVVKTHNYGRDFSALQKLLPLNLRYVGLIGPRKRRDQLLNNLLDIGVTMNAGFFAPAGLDLGSETPEEIALAIVAEIQRVFGSGCGDSLRERKISIHDARRRLPDECEKSAR